MKDFLSIKGNPKDNDGFTVNDIVKLYPDFEVLVYTKIRDTDNFILDTFCIIAREFSVEESDIVLKKWYDATKNKYKLCAYINIQTGLCHINTTIVDNTVSKYIFLQLLDLFQIHYFEPDYS